MPKNNYVIIHGQLIAVSDDVLMHWKYIKREKKNGRWVYYYDQSSLDKIKDNYYNDVTSSARYAKTNASLRKKLSRMSTTNSNYEKTKKALERSEANFKTSNARAKASEKKYNQMKISSFAERAISKGAVKVANFFSKLFSKKK